MDDNRKLAQLEFSEQSEGCSTMRIINFPADDPGLIKQAAEILVEAFREHWPDAWPTIVDAQEEVEAFAVKDRISRFAVADDGTLLGWIGGLEMYDGKVWELHPLAVHPSVQGQGIGRALVEDLEMQVAARGGLTLWLGSDDETGMTSLGGIDLYPDPLGHLANIKNLRRHPYEFYRKQGFVISGVLPDANGFGKPDIFMAKRVAQNKEQPVFRLKVDDEIEIRMLEEIDAETIFALVDRNREHLRQWLIWVDRSNSPEVTRQFIKESKQQYENKEAMSAGIWFHGQLAGAIGVVRYDWYNRKMEIGYWISSDQQGKGIITRSVSALITDAFDNLGLNRVEIQCATGNVRSRAIPERLDFKQDGIMREASVLSGGFVDKVIYSMLASEWKGGKR